MTNLYQELYVISDLHLGGEEGFQIFRLGKELAALIGRLAEKPLAADGRLGLVINGDSVDFLAEPGAAYFDIDGAVTKLNAIMGRPAFKPVFEALADFVATEGRELILVLGNHDLELALPDVRTALLERLTRFMPDRLARVRFAFDGTGFRCQVGPARVLCLHGNEFDGFNVVDFELLRKVQRQLQREVTPEKQPCMPGTRVVVDVMNRIKRTYRWVDLLKPETHAVFPTLLALEPSYAKYLAQLLDEVKDTVVNQGLIECGFLGAGPGRQATAADTGESLLLELLTRNYDDLDEPAPAHGEEALFQRAQELLEGRRPVSNRPIEGETLGLGEGIGGWLRDKIELGRAELLRRCLRGLLKDDGSFDPTRPDSTFKGVEKAVGPIDFTIAGHTHLERAIVRSNHKYYLNCGTWAPLMRIAPAQLASTEAFKPLYQALTQSALAASSPYVYEKPTLARILQEAPNVVSGQLFHWVNAALQPVLTPMTIQ